MTIESLRLNRTNVELKQLCAGVVVLMPTCLNRTNVELKHVFKIASADRIGRLNRTNVELKPRTVLRSRAHRKVLIEPMWN